MRLTGSATALLVAAALIAVPANAARPTGPRVSQPSGLSGLSSTPPPWLAGGGSLPQTGVDLSVEVTIGLVLIGVGVMLRLLSRRPAATRRGGVGSGDAH